MDRRTLEHIGLYKDPLESSTESRETPIWKVIKIVATMIPFLSTL